MGGETMNAESVITIIENNWPPSQYTMLREALTLAIEAIKIQASLEAELASAKQSCIKGRCGGCRFVVHNERVDPENEWICSHKYFGRGVEHCRTTPEGYCDEWEAR
jgi:hypothetical protein